MLCTIDYKFENITNSKPLRTERGKIWTFYYLKKKKKKTSKDCTFSGMKEEKKKPQKNWTQSQRRQQSYAMGRYLSQQLFTSPKWQAEIVQWTSCHTVFLHVTLWDKRTANGNRAPPNALRSVLPGEIFDFSFIYFTPRWVTGLLAYPDKMSANPWQHLSSK